MIGVTTAMAVSLTMAFKDGNMLQADCLGLRRPVCVSYIQGVMDTIALFENAPGGEKTFCIPPNATAGQLADVVVKHLGDHPAERAQTAASLTFKAVHQAFACVR